MTSRTGIIIGREYMERVRKKSFIITTLLMPLLMLAMMVVPVLITEFSESDTRRMVIVDDSGMIAGQIKNTSEFTVVEQEGDWRSMLEDGTADSGKCRRQFRAIAVVHLRPVVDQSGE